MSADQPFATEWGKKKMCVDAERPELIHALKVKLQRLAVVDNLDGGMSMHLTMVLEVILPTGRSHCPVSTLHP